MAIATGQLVTKSDVINAFNSNVIDNAYSGSPWHAGNVPVTDHSVSVSKNWSGTGVSAGVRLIPNGQLDSNTKPYISSLGNDTVITASTVVNLLTEATRQITRVRNCTVNWYYSVDGTYGLQQSNTNKAIFKATTTAVSGSTPPYYTKSPNVTNMLQTIRPSSTGISAGQIIAANTMNNFLNSLKSAWQAAYNNTVTYNYYTCHNQCYTDPCFTRSRR